MTFEEWFDLNLKRLCEEMASGLKDAARLAYMAGRKQQRIDSGKETRRRPRAMEPKP